MNVSKVGEGKVVLLAGGGKCFTDIAARFTRSERGLEEIAGSEYDKELVRRILSSGHLAATEFDYFIFGVEGYSRVTEVQLVRKRLASYLIKSGRVDKKGKRSYDVVLPDSIMKVKTAIEVPFEDSKLALILDTQDILDILEKWYDSGIKQGVKEEDLRYLKPQATEFKAIIGMNAHALLDWFKIRMCKNAQAEIRDLATKMCTLCKTVAPDLFANAGPSCISLGYCPENSMQNKECYKITKEEALRILDEYQLLKKSIEHKNK